MAIAVIRLNVYETSVLPPKQASVINSLPALTNMDNALCLCGSSMIYLNCCKPFHINQSLPATAQALMRSRYSAYSLQLESYLLSTWDTHTRPSTLNLGDSQQRWEKLDIIRCKQGGQNDAKGTVEFNAFFTENNESWLLHERSQFVKIDGQWFYVDGLTRIIPAINGTIASNKNAPCPCGSGKKFKRCCGATHV